MGTGVEPTSAYKAATSSSYVLSLSNRTRTPVNSVGWPSRDDMACLLRGDRDGVLETIVDVRAGRAIDQQADKFRAAVMACRIHLRLAVIDQREIELRIHVS